MTGKEIDIFDEMERKRLIKREFTGLYKRFRSLDKDTLATVKPLCENAAFMVLCRNIKTEKTSGGLKKAHLSRFTTRW